MSRHSRLLERIDTLFVEQLNLRVPSAETDLVEAGLLDSLAFVDLLLHLEREFDVSIPPDDLELDHFRSVVRIARYLEGRSDPKGDDG